MESPADVWDLFRHYDKLYFRGALAGAAFTVDWASPRMKTITSGFGSCSFGKTGKTITLYKPMLQDRPSADLKNALLHLLIHAIIFVKHGMTCLSRHGPVFRDWMDAINACSVEDYLRPEGGYCITTTHDFSQEKHCSIQGNLWKCELCGVTLLRATKLGPPSDSCCTENVSQHTTCGNMLCNWHNHKTNCGGTYVVPKRGQKMVPKGGLGLVSETSEISKSQGDVQESDSDEKSLGSCSSEKAEDFQKAIVSSASPPSKLKWKQASVASLYSLVGRSNAKLLDISSKKAHKQRKHDEDTRKPIARPAASHSILKQKNKTNSSAKAGKQQHDPEDSRRTFLQPAVVSQRKPKQSNPAAPPKRSRTGSKTGPSPTWKKEYACVSVWANIYESECSSGSAEPLVNKRTERRKREREGSIKAQPAEEDISSQRMDIVIPSADQATTRAHGDPSIPASRHVDIAAVPPADHQVMTRAPVNHQVVQPHSADPLSSTPSNPSSSPDVVDISDDD